jgi:hypothetical protein
VGDVLQLSASADPTTVEGEATSVLTVTVPSQAVVANFVMLSISCSHGSVQPSARNITEGVFSVTFNYRAPEATDESVTVVCSYQLSGEDERHFNAPPDTRLTVAAVERIELQVEGPSSMVAGASGQVRMRPSAAAPSAFEVKIDCPGAAAVEPSSLSFEADSTDEQSFTLTAPASVGDLTCSFVVEGEEAERVTVSPLSIEVTPVPPPGEMDDSSSTGQGEEEEEETSSSSSGEEEEDDSSSSSSGSDDDDDDSSSSSSGASGSLDPCVDGHTCGSFANAIPSLSLYLVMAMAAWVMRQ